MMFNVISKGKRTAIIEDTTKAKVFGVISGWRYPRKIINIKNFDKYITPAKPQPIGKE